jgi:hypothetical protein
MGAGVGVLSGGSVTAIGAGIGVPEGGSATAAAGLVVTATGPPLVGPDPVKVGLGVGVGVGGVRAAGVGAGVGAGAGVGGMGYASLKSATDMFRNLPSVDLSFFTHASTASEGWAEIQPAF